MENLLLMRRKVSPRFLQGQRSIDGLSSCEKCSSNSQVRLPFFTPQLLLFFLFSFPFKGKSFEMKEERADDDDDDGDGLHAS